VVKDTLEIGLALADNTDQTCDRCGPGIRAIWLVETEKGPLTFCGSCYRAFKAAQS
jgi:hypothetical protein